MRVLIEQSYLMINGKKISVTISIGAAMARDNDFLENFFKIVDSLLKVRLMVVIWFLTVRGYGIF